jgi:hypothetical protein
VELQWRASGCGNAVSSCGVYGKKYLPLLLANGPLIRIKKERRATTLASVKGE